MGINFFEWLVNSTSTTNNRNTPSRNTPSIDCRVIMELSQQYALRRFAFNTCVNMVANAISKCEFKTYLNGKENKGKEYYIWNIEPNTNQNSSAFLHKLISKLYEDNEVLVISSTDADGKEHLNVVDSFNLLHSYPVKQNVYQNVVVEDVAYTRVFYEKEVLHIKLNNEDVKAVLDAMNNSYSELIAVTEKAFGYNMGQHWKVHIDQVAQGTDDFEETLNQIMQEQIIPFLQSNNGVLTEYDGYNWQDVGGSKNGNSRDIRALYNDIFDFTAKAFNIPSVLLGGEVADTSEAIKRWLTLCIDPLADQVQEEIVRKRYGFNEWKNKSYLKIDTSCLMHFDMFEQAGNIDKLISSGVFSPNMILEACNKEPIGEDWANEHYITKNYSPIEEALNLKGGGNNA